MWARGDLCLGPAPEGGADREVTAALAAFGLVQDNTEDAPQAATPAPVYYLWPCNVAALQLWFAVQTQWMGGAMGEREGLNYAGVAAYMREVARIRPRRFRELFEGLQAMERAVLDVWAQERAKRAK